MTLQQEVEKKREKSKAAKTAEEEYDSYDSEDSEDEDEVPIRMPSEAKWNERRMERQEQLRQWQVRASVERRQRRRADPDDPAVPAVPTVPAVHVRFQEPLVAVEWVFQPQNAGRAATWWR
eukprot:m.12373 g.12373  ORF g.12373 m.12373 type:complete len:121 (+) comp6845_c0_seq1:79-441(+)